MKFADTSWWVAWTMPRAGRHDEAVQMRQNLGPNEQVLTTNLVLGESWNFVCRRANHRTAVGFLDRVDLLRDHDRLLIHRVTEEQELAAWTWLRKHDERTYSFVDATSFRVMRDRRLREALAFDQAFAAAGFTEIQT
ncbi:MAG: type II toxin-antitoxin system VapC family toxin [Acidimicrobiia bacterium]